MEETEKSVKLKNCPFCGGGPYHSGYYVDAYETERVETIQCSICRASVSGPYLTTAIKKWNRRVGESNDQN